MLASILVARMLGKEGFGELGIIQSSIGMFGVFAGFGLGVTATKYVAEFREQNPIKAGKIIGLSSIVSLSTGGLMTLALIILSPWLATKTLNAPQLSGLLLLSSPLLLLSAWSGAQGGALAGFEAFRRLAQLNLITGLLNFPLMVVGVYLGGLSGAICGMVGASLIGCFLNRRALRYEMRKAGVQAVYFVSRSDLQILWKFSLPSTLGGIMVSPIYWVCSAKLVNQPNGYSEMGIFNAANQWYNALLFFPGIIGTVILPILSETSASNKDGNITSRILSVSIFVNALIAIPLTIMICLFSSSIMTWYGKGYSESWLVLVTVACTAGLLAVQTPVGHFIAANGKMWVGLFMNLIWGMAFIIFTDLLIYRGAYGLALARLLAYLLHALSTFGFAFIIIKGLKKQNV